MKFYVAAAFSTPVPPEMGTALYEASIEWLKAKIKEGKIECHYTYPQGGGFAIVVSKSHEELTADLQSFPLFPFMSWEVIPVVDWEFGYNLGVEAFKKMAG